MMSDDPLWVPLLTHYASSEATTLDRDRVGAHVQHISPFVKQMLIGGTTGDGWQLSDKQLVQWIEIASKRSIFTPDHTLLFGAFGETTRDVVARARLIERTLETHAPVAKVAGLTVCPPKIADATQENIVDHFRMILAETNLDLSVYQLPQIVGCKIEPSTLQRIRELDPRIAIFKDTSGDDAIALSGIDFKGIQMLRGAEGDYAEHIGPSGHYDGWLVSSANCFARELRSIADRTAAGEFDEARRVSGRLSKLVGEMFATVAAVGAVNPFATTNRIVDHLMAYGDDWPRRAMHTKDPRGIQSHAVEKIRLKIEAAGFNSLLNICERWPDR